MPDTYFIYGPELGRKPSAVKVELIGTDSNGSLRFEDVNSSDKWTFTSDEVAELHNSSLMGPVKMFDTTTNLWNAFQTVSSQEMDDNLESAARELFEHFAPE